MKEDKKILEQELKDYKIRIILKGLMQVNKKLDISPEAIMYIAKEIYNQLFKK